MTPSIPAECLQQAIIYYYHLSFCLPKERPSFYKTTDAVRKEMAERAGMKEAAFFRQALPEVCFRIVAYHQATREPQLKLVAELVEAAGGAGKSARAGLAFQEKMAQVATLPGRARPENRLHRNKGCSFCTVPCRYGYFSLVSDPKFPHLQNLLVQESSQPPAKQNPLRPVHRFAMDTLLRLPGTKRSFYDHGQVANLSYCLLLLGMAKSRMALPESQLRIFQSSNQEYIQHKAAG